MSQNILIVDDSATIRRVIRRTLGLAGLDVGEVYEAANGIEALATLRDHCVGVILLDINMPHMNGIQLLKRMKSDDQLKDIAVVMATSEGSDERMQESREMGALAFIRKPFHPEQLRDLLAPLMGVIDDGGQNDDRADDFF